MSEKLSKDKFCKYLFLSGVYLLLLPFFLNIEKLFSGSYFFYGDYLSGSTTSFSGNFLNFLFLFFVFTLLFFSYFYILKEGIFLSNVAISLTVFAFFLLPPIGSSDWMLYFNIGREVFKGVDPYLKGVSFVNPFFSILGSVKFGEVKNFLPTTPLFNYFLLFLYIISFKKLFLFLIWLKFFSLSFLILIYRVFLKFPGIEGEKLKLLIFGNPFLLFEFLSNCHYDLFWVFFAVGVVYFLFSEKKLKAIVFFFLTSLIKYSGFGSIFLFLRRKRFKIFFFALIGYIALFYILSFQFNFEIFKILRGLKIQVFWAKYSLIHLISITFPLHSVKLIFSIMGLLLILSFLYFKRDIIWEEKSHEVDFFLLTFLYLIAIAFFSAVLYPWYVLWVYFFSIPLFFSERGRDIFNLLLFTVYFSQIIYPIEYLFGRVGVSVMWEVFYVSVLYFCFFYTIFRFFRFSKN